MALLFGQSGNGLSNYGPVTTTFIGARAGFYGDGPAGGGGAYGPGERVAA